MAVMCSDCGCKITHMSETTLRKGSSVREPGEPLCLSCSAKRSKMVRELNALPSDLHSIKAMRMVRA